MELRGLIKKNISGRKVIFFFVTANLLYLVMLLITIPMVMAYSNGIKLFDLMPSGYDLAYAKKLLETLGADGRMVYLTRQLPVDMFYPGFSGIAYFLLTGWLFNKLNLLDKPAVYLCLVPLAAGLFDYFENFGIIMMITSYPGISGSQVCIASTFSVIKSMLSLLFFVILIAGFIVFLIKAGYRKVIS